MPTKHNTPLRYPGGKSKVSSFLEDIIVLNGLEGCVLYELYAGGAGASINLLYSGLCKKIVLNDLDFHIYSFWRSILAHPDKFIRKIEATSVDVGTWNRQKHIYDNCDKYNFFEVGFSTFYLNRTNRSGILYKAGPIGGFDQTGKYKIDARFNKSALIQRIEKLSEKKDKIEIYNEESIDLLKKIMKRGNEKRFVFLDPPYYVQGENLYLNCYSHQDHKALSEILSKFRQDNWLLTYDNIYEINQLYNNFRRFLLPMSYTLQAKRKAKEIGIFADGLNIPKSLRMGSKINPLKLVNS